MVIVLAPTESQYSIGADNYQKPQLPTAIMADADFDTKSYHLSIELLSTHSLCSGFVYIGIACMLLFWRLLFEWYTVIIAARQWRRKRRAEGNLQNGMLVITNQPIRRMMVIYISLW